MSDPIYIEGAHIHPGRDPVTGEGGNSLGCLVPNKSDFEKLNTLLKDNYEHGGAHLNIGQTPPARLPEQPTQ